MGVESCYFYLILYYINMFMHFVILGVRQSLILTIKMELSLTWTVLVHLVPWFLVRLSENVS